jgi:diaminohydroxyphosphoribosylaminopyrimidine deaminase/5-amino-6-(5-phosphoribosylamino)uracil reductase
LGSEAGSKTQDAEEAWAWILTACDRLRQGLPVDKSDAMLAIPRWPEWVQLYLPLLRPEPLVLGQLGQTLDGRIATVSGHSHYVTGEPDRQHLHRLRAQMDAVVVGVGTICADNPRLTVRMVHGPQPVRVVLDPRGRMPLGSEVLQDGAGPTLWLRAAPGLQSEVQPHVEVLLLPETVPGGGFAPADVLALLRSRGLQRVLVEGGGVTVSRFLQEGLLDRLFLTLAPMLLGSGRPSITLQPIVDLAQALRPKTRRFQLGEDTLFDLDLQ